MDTIRHRCKILNAAAALTSIMALVLIMPLQAPAQDKQPGNEPPTHSLAGESPHQDSSLADQLRELQAKVAKLEAALKQKHQAKTSETSGGMGMKMGNMPMSSGAKKGSMAMGMMGRGMMGMGSMGKKGSAAAKEMSDKGKMAGMKMMGRMKDMGGAKAAEPLPAFPGAPGIYHVGASGFYLDYANEISLTPEQQAKLKQIQQESMNEQAAFDQQIIEADQQLGELTGSDQPDATKIEAKVREIERLRSDQRVAFIRSVGKAAAVLTDQQRKILTTQGSAADGTTPDTPSTEARQ